MSLITRYLNFNSNDIIFEKLGINPSDYNGFITYTQQFLNNQTKSEQTTEYINSQLTNYVDKNFSLFDALDVDINYYLEKINIFIEKKFKDIIDEINLSQIISMCDYFEKKNELSIMRLESDLYLTHYEHWKQLYYHIVWDKFFCGEYKIHGFDKKEKLLKAIENNWNKIKFDNLVGFSNSLNKMKFLKQNVGDYIGLFANKFDDRTNLAKLLEYIEKKLSIEDPKIKTSESEEEIINESVEFNDDEKETKKSNSKYNFRFIVDNLKTNGYLLFEEYNKNLKKKYKKSQSIYSIRTDKRIMNYFMYLIQQKPSNTTNRKVNEILIRMRDWLEDIEESYYNNIAYKKINVKQESEKYKSVDLSSYNRENSSFTIFKYSNTTSNKINGFIINSQIEPYFDIYKSYYNSRYPDREIEYDPIKSTLIVKMIFNSKPYYIHLALIQYIVMDKLFKIESNEGLEIKEISSQTGIEIKNLQQTINSLLHIKLIKHSANTSNIADMKFFVNYDFTHSTNKISICSLVIPKEQEVEKERELMHDRNTIVLSNLYDYVKKNKTFTIDKIYEEMSKNIIPFKIELEQLISGIKIMIEKEDIIETNENNIKTYKYSE